MMHQNKIALVTGGSRGLGRAIATQLARSGADVVLTYREKRDEADAVVAEIRALGRQAIARRLDVARTDTFAAFAAELRSALETTWGRPSFDFLVNNAGINRPSLFAEATEAAVDELFAVHFKGVFFLTQRLLPLLADGGRIVNFSSGLARFTTPGYSAYAAMKGAVEVLTRYLAKELGSRRISVNTIAPGIIETDFTKESLSRSGVQDFLAGNIALGRIGAPEDIGGAVDLLCAEASRWINGQRVEASGGMFL
ncbi:MAG TPA: SDR family oxidoreductase [Candidatus Synoicihabitans sp.]|nr:SDR family oxidoreductase [Candidatus Synoicihabitans sp.]